MAASMIDFAIHRAKLEARIAEVRAAKQPQLVDDEDSCKHEWQRFKQTIRTNNDKFSGTAYFVVKACVKCHVKESIGYVVER